MFKKQSFLRVYNTLLSIYDYIPENTWVLGEQDNELFPLKLSFIQTGPKWMTYLLRKNKSSTEEEICLVKNRYALAPLIGHDYALCVDSSIATVFMPAFINALCRSDKLSLNFENLIDYFSKLPTLSLSTEIDENLYMDYSSTVTTYIGGLGFNKENIYLNDQVIKQGEALIFNKDNLYSPVDKDSCTCDFSLDWGSFSNKKKPLKFHNSKSTVLYDRVKFH